MKKFRILLYLKSDIVKLCTKNIFAGYLKPSKFTYVMKLLLIRVSVI